MMRMHQTVQNPKALKAHKHSKHTSTWIQMISDKITIGFRPADWLGNGHGVEQLTM